MNDSMFEISFQPGEEVVIRLRPPNLKMMKGETAQHLIGAKKEMLMALRSLLDEAINKTEAAAAPEEEKTRIKVE
ncbi:hypothetical protein Dform_02035 [Dehalogenimonas formicexedens]|uniref:Uncharacterized protein n=1 Tax=Dehalogenimonas formicexedens TaxID=1839801 RepID=A0A1P8FA62_9CHLR|nr:hypothetical protein [Dehalogenimonas formicexedens]APV45347.1 hypothetical protein Dform_02035 [Dehalogenimonas formicexedens]